MPTYVNPTTGSRSTISDEQIAQNPQYWKSQQEQMMESGFQLESAAPPVAPVAPAGTPDATLTGQQTGGTFGGNKYWRVGDAVFQVTPSGEWEYVSQGDFTGGLQQQGLNLDVIPQFSGAAPQGAFTDYKTETGKDLVIPSSSLGGGGSAKDVVGDASGQMDSFLGTVQKYFEALKGYQEQVLASMQPTEEEKALREQITSTEASAEMGLNKIEAQPIPMEFITGQQRELAKDAQARLNYLNNRLGLMQGDRQTQLKAAQFMYDAGRNNINDTIALYQATAPDSISTFRDDDGNVTAVMRNPITGEVYVSRVGNVGAGATKISGSTTGGTKGTGKLTRDEINTAAARLGIPVDEFKSWDFDAQNVVANNWTAIKSFVDGINESVGDNGQLDEETYNEALANIDDSELPQDVKTWLTQKVLALGPTEIPAGDSWIGKFADWTYRQFQNLF